MPHETTAHANHTTAPFEGVHFYADGQAGFSGSSLRLYAALDRMFAAWASPFEAIDHRVPPMLPAAELDRIDYFRSFPHLVTFPVALDESSENLKAFADHGPVGPDGSLQLAKLASVRSVLTPAACYHFYVQHRGRCLNHPAFLTTCATCFRREASYTPLARQWSFNMREIVCIGTEGEVQSFLAIMTDRVHSFARSIALPVAFNPATDPFFDPSGDPKYYAQRLAPLKTEVVFGDALALGSINFHRDYFGRGFSIHRGAELASSGCVAFGIERWMLALLSHFGPRQERWPAVLCAALGLEQAAARPSAAPCANGGLP